MKTFKKIVCVVLSMAMCLCSFAIFVDAASTTSLFYSTAGTATSSEIEVSTNKLNQAKKTAREIKSAVTYVCTIENAYDVHIFHFVAPKAGYYAFYTTGAKDTIIRIYEHQILSSYKTSSDMYDDDSSMADDNCLNSCVVLNLDKGEDYYVCVRMYNKNKGTYTLHIEPNQDKMMTSEYGYSMWEKDPKSLSLIESLNTSYTASKQYFSPEETVFFYFMLKQDNNMKDSVNGCDYGWWDVYQTYRANKELSWNIANAIIGVLINFCDLGKGASVVFSISMTGLSHIMDQLMNSTYMTKDSMIKYLEGKCLVSKISNNQYTAIYGLLVTQTTQPITHIDYNSQYSYTTYDTYYTFNPISEGLLRTGVTSKSGTWS